MTTKQQIEADWQEFIDNVDMGKVTPEERQRRGAMIAEALRNGSEVRGVVNGKVVVLNGGK